VPEDGTELVPVRLAPPHPITADEVAAGFPDGRSAATSRSRPTADRREMKKDRPESPSRRPINSGTRPVWRYSWPGGTSSQPAAGQVR